MSYVLITHLAVVEAIGSTSWSKLIDRLRINLVVTNIHRYELRLMYQVVYLDANNTDKKHFQHLWKTFYSISPNSSPFKSILK